MNYIYALKDPISGVIRYIGNTKNPKGRYRQHLKDAEKRSKTLKQNWIRSLSEKNMQPTMDIIEKIENDEEARNREEFYVLQNIDTVYNIHLPGKGSKDISFYKKTGKIK